jgi:hypothetical protein
LTQIETKNPSSDEPLWTPLQVATYLQLVGRDGKPNPELVSNLLLKDPKMPRPKKLGHGRRGRNRFEPDEIRAYRKSLPRCGDGKAPINADGTPAKKRGRKPKATVGGGAA